MFYNINKRSPFICYFYWFALTIWFCQEVLLAVYESLSWLVKKTIRCTNRIITIPQSFTRRIKTRLFIFCLKFRRGNWKKISADIGLSVVNIPSVVVVVVVIDPVQPVVDNRLRRGSQTTFQRRQKNSIHVDQVWQDVDDLLGPKTQNFFAATDSTLP